METIRLMTWIDAPMDRCFRLATSIDLHIASVPSTKEKAVDGVKTGLIGKDETVTWQGRHYGMKLHHTSRIDTWRPYSYFRDVMVDGVFSHFEHEHFFAVMNDGTRMQDVVRFSAPWGWMGRMATRMFVRKHLIRFLAQKNAELKRVAESEEWHRYLDGRPEASSEICDESEISRGWNDKNIVLPRMTTR